MMRPISCVAVMVVLALLLGGAEPVAAESMKVVTPGAYENAEAPGAVTSGLTNGRHQQIYPASDFASLPQDYRTITHINMRPDGDTVGSRTVSFDGLVISFSTTSASPGSLSTTFANNIGGDVTVVFDSGVSGFTYSTQNIGPAGGPKEFDWIVALQTPFYYDPSQGNLLLDQTWSGFQGPGSLDSIDLSSPAAQLIGTPDPQSASSAYDMGGFVTQFTVTPEPSTVASLLSMGIVGLIGFWWRRRKA